MTRALESIKVTLLTTHTETAQTMNYTDLAKDAGYNESPEKMEEIGMAIERGMVAWNWFENGNDKFDVAAIFQYRDSEPNYEETVGAYAEGAANS